MKRPRRAPPARSSTAPPRRTSISTRGRILNRIFGDMMRLDDAGAGSGSTPAGESTLWSGPDAECREAAWRADIHRRVDELREKLRDARVGSYQILEEIAAGGMGIVFKARQESPMFTREIALKFMLSDPEAGQDDRQRFIAEVKGLAGLSHPSLVHIFDSGIEGDLYYFSMELVDGWSLDDSERCASLSAARKVEAVRDIARALAYLHSRGVIHRDVKPGNIMIDRDGRTKLLDFGIAQFTVDPHERAVQAGTPYFMAPEVIDPRGGFGPIGPGTDVYALGAVLYQLLVGKPVFESSLGLGDVLASTLSATPEFPRQRSRRLPADLQAIVARTLKKRVGERHPGAAALADELDAFLRRERRRAPAWAAGAAAAAALAVAAFVARDAPPPSAIAPPQRDMSAWEERIDDAEAVDPAAAAPLRELLRLARGEATVPAGAASRLAAAARTFWNERVKTALGDALGAKQAYLDVRVKESRRLNDLFRDPNRKLEEARSRPADRTAHQLLVEARDGFEQCRAAAESALAEDRLALERDHAAAARERALDSRREIQSELESAGYGFEGDALTAWEAAAAQIAGAEAVLDTRPAEARALFHRALDGIYRAGAIARAEHDARRARCRVEREAFELDHDRRADRLARNLPRSLALELRQLRNSPAGGQDESLKEVERRLALQRQKLAAAVSLVEAAERSAQAARAKAQHLSTRRRVPAPLAPRRSRALAALAEGDAQMRAESFQAAKSSFDAAAGELAGLAAEAARVTRGMVWVDGSAEVPGFWIDRCETTVADYARFGRHLPAEWQRQLEAPERPVVGVTLEGAAAYARWHGKKLPASSQWLAAAGVTGHQGRRFPFGDRFDARLVNAAGNADGFEHLAPAASLEGGASPWGCVHLSGNAAEWTVEADGTASLRGGSFLTGEPEFLRADARYVPRQPFAADASAQRTAGFRCVLHAEAEESGSP